MKKSLVFHRLYAAVLLLTVNTLTWAYDFEVGGIYYDINSDATSVTVGNKTYGCYSGAIIIPSQVTYNSNIYNVISIGESAFEACYNLEYVTIPNSVTSIGESAFENCKGLKSVSIANGLKSIGDRAFFNCRSLTSIDIPNSVTSIGNYSFELCIGLKSVTIANGVISIGNGAFWDCSGLGKIDIPTSVTSIGSSAFRDCSSLTFIIIPNSVTSIGSYAFSGTPWYNNHPDGLVYAGEVAYKYKGTMPIGTLITIIEGTLGIAMDAFRGCSGLTSVSIPNSMTNIGMQAFSGCSGLTSVICHATNVPITNYYSFENVPQMSATLHVPASSIDAYKATYPWNMFGTIIPIAGPTFILGDANNNGEVEIGDVTSVLTLMANPSAEGYNKKAADANGNGEIEIGDVTAILNIMAGGTE